MRKHEDVPEAKYSTSEVIRAVGLVRFADRRLLLVRADYQDAFYLPGGKIDPGETEVQALHREVREELGVELVGPDFYRRYETDAVGQGEGVQVSLSCYSGELDGEPVPAAEIAELAWMTREEYLARPVTAPAIVALYADLDPA
ncbi:ADP-ribose pyrophosphatase YjhB, NUDIX family [Saccharopolyspora antimicrobica]|uniref:ADP-ribose pyrophosphatase YjhB (NUDIX family) n=1 Tax=Saccharopolyspora antimicrobica TaxID=455193 RepID=A0A1I5A206_9PSEU|nr:ADP-ribose pyrophosphatase YjhB (NUDIX family) [Saccharopolyspora antimicrobica]SFN56393.1 ADP-ribose pyrophosphatase YjhB, NUDIX family [Saccharopolyspora antimicrobica]